MKARAILTIHTILFLLFVAVSIGSPFIVVWYPDIFVGKYIVVTAGVLMLLVIGSWPLCGGCPFTVWENRFKKKAGHAPYIGPCIDHYAARWFGLRFPGNASTLLLVGLLLLPIVVGIVHW
jgi:hypothetical protein